MARAEDERRAVIKNVTSTLADTPNTRASLLDKMTTNNMGAAKTAVLRGLEAGAGIEISVQDADDNRFTTDEKKIVISATSAALGGEANTASNIGLGVDIFKQKTGVDLEFKSLSSVSNRISITNNASDVLFDIVPGNIDITTLLNAGDIVQSDISDFATATQGGLADTAIQPAALTAALADYMLLDNTSFIVVRNQVDFNTHYTAGSKCLLMFPGTYTMPSTTIHPGVDVIGCGFRERVIINGGNMVHAGPGKTMWRNVHVSFSDMTLSGGSFFAENFNLANELIINGASAVYFHEHGNTDFITMTNGVCTLVNVNFDEAGSTISNGTLGIHGGTTSPLSSASPWLSISGTGTVLISDFVFVNTGAGGGINVAAGVLQTTGITWGSPGSGLGGIFALTQTGGTIQLGINNFPVPDRSISGGTLVPYSLG